MNNIDISQVLSIIVGIVVLVAIFGYIYYKYKKSNDEKAQKALQDFEDSLKSKVEEYIVKYIDSTDFSQFNGLTDAQITILNNLYNEVWDLVTDELSKLEGTDPVTAALIKKVITRENIESWVKSVYDSYKPQQTFAAKYDENIISGTREAVELEKKTFKEGRDYDEGLVKSEFSKTVYEEDQEKVEKEKSKLNPPKDEDPESYNANDDSVEILDDNLDDENTNFIEKVNTEFNSEDN